MSIELLSAFNFIDQEDIIHKLDPRTKILIVINYMILFFMINELLIQLILLITLIPLIFLGKMSQTVLKSLRGMTFLLFFIVFLNTIFSSLNLGIQLALRLINILIAFSILFQTTHPDDLSQAITKIGIPYHISFAFSLAFRFVPTLAQEAETITNAQRSRGLNFQKGGMMQQMKNLFPLLIPLISNSVQRAYYIAESLESRSFGTEIKRTYTFPIKIKIMDILFILLSIILLIAGIYLKRNIELFPIFQFIIPL
ncbi:MAG: energy-coupling factor transporter transmembrane protein EcfT [archaeon]|nr:energy-coupling factor transporter transmembrane protein EcfT [archaeon]